MNRYLHPGDPEENNIIIHDSMAIAFDGIAIAYCTEIKLEDGSIFPFLLFAASSLVGKGTSPSTASTGIVSFLDLGFQVSLESIGAPSLAPPTGSLAPGQLLLELPRGEPLGLAHPLQQDQDGLFVELVLGELLSQQALQSLVDLDIVLGHHGDGLSRFSRPCRSAHPVDVVLSVTGQVEVDDQVDVGDIEPASRHVRADQDRPRAAGKLVQGTQALGLGHLAVQADGGKSEIAKHQGQPLHVVAGGPEYQHGLSGVFVDEVRQVAILVLGRNEQVGLQEFLGGLKLCGDLDLDWVLETGSLEFLDLGGHGRRKEQRFSVFGDDL
mmetsp:Transcript_65427/g.133084  ORF Transcript_65427/g.133084 Transcript_65427/m.133084 type:complete len:325 (-) Transcript_65427:267-1241(-)